MPIAKIEPGTVGLEKKFLIKSGKSKGNYRLWILC